MIIMYISAVFVAFLLRHQERIHYLELKIPTLESWLNVLLGIFLILLGSLSLVTELIVMKDNLPVPREQFTFIAVVLATGITMVIFGIQSLQRNHQFAKNNSAQC